MKLDWEDQEEANQKFVKEHNVDGSVSYRKGDSSWEVIGTLETSGDFFDKPLRSSEDQDTISVLNEDVRRLHKKNQTLVTDVMRWSAEAARSKELATNAKERVTELTRDVGTLIDAAREHLAEGTRWEIARKDLNAEAVDRARQIKEQREEINTLNAAFAPTLKERENSSNDKKGGKWVDAEYLDPIELDLVDYLKEYVGSNQETEQVRELKTENHELKVERHTNLVLYIDALQEAKDRLGHLRIQFKKAHETVSECTWCGATQEDQIDGMTRGNEE